MTHVFIRIFLEIQQDPTVMEDPLKGSIA